MPSNNIAGEPDKATILPDSLRTKGPFRPFSSDPGWSEAWWWLGLPVVLVVFLIVSQAVSDKFYARWILPEGFGFLEFGQFLIVFAAMLVALWLMSRAYIRARRLIFWFLFIMALGCFYIAGEEISWGQTFFQWSTPEYWSSINRQQETNLHNALSIFGKNPRAILEIGIYFGGLVLPFLAVFFPVIRANRWSLFFPPDAMVPAALGALLFKLTSTLNNFEIQPLVMRPAEATEFFLYGYLLFFLIMFARRIDELEREGLVMHRTSSASDPGVG